MGAPAFNYTYNYSRTNSIVFLTDNLHTTLRDVIRENGLDPRNLADSWETIERGIKAWLESGHLRKIVVEFYRPGASIASARWDFPIGYDGSGADDDMWPDKAYLRQLVAKSARPSPDCIYRILLVPSKGAPPVHGFSDCAFLSTGQLSARQAGTVIATGHMTAAATYWR